MCGEYWLISFIEYHYRDLAFRYQVWAAGILRHFASGNYVYDSSLFLCFERCCFERYSILNVSITHRVSEDTLSKLHCFFMKTSSNGNIFRVTGHLCGEFTGPRWTPSTKASDVELWCFLWSVPELTVGWTIVRLVIWDAIAPIMTSL